MPFKPKRLGDVPIGLPDHHKRFLTRLKDAVEILMGAVAPRGVTAPGEKPGSQAVTFDDLGDLVSSGTVVIQGIEDQSMLFAYLFGDEGGAVG